MQSMRGTTTILPYYCCYEASVSAPLIDERLAALGPHDFFHALSKRVRLPLVRGVEARVGGSSGAEVAHETHRQSDSDSCHHGFDKLLVLSRLKAVVVEVVVVIVVVRVWNSL